MGSSIVFWASQRSKRDAERWTVLTAQEVEWHGERGMGWSRFRPKLEALLQKAPPPQWLCVLLGSNDLGKKPLHELISCAQINLSYIATVSPGTKVIWFDILPRIQYRGAISDALFIPPIGKIYNALWGHVAYLLTPWRRQIIIPVCYDILG